MKRLAPFMIVALALAACTAQNSPLQPEDQIAVSPVMSVVDGTRDGGNPLFFWDRPINPWVAWNVYDDFDPSYLTLLAVEICEWDGHGCVDMLHRFTSEGDALGSETHGSDRLKILDPDSYPRYGVWWDAGGDHVELGKIYRISVTAGSNTLGYADVKVVEGWDVWTIDRTQYMGINAGWWLPIEFVVRRDPYPWRDHADPYSFLFGNHIDTHQQLRHGVDWNLEGMFYITLKGDFTGDYPNAMHGNCEVLQEDCVVGWELSGVPAVATLIEKLPGEHPKWCVDVAPEVVESGYTHFHWLGQPEHAHHLEAGHVYYGHLLKLDAVRPFFFKHHGGFQVDPGIDFETHYNVVTGC